MFWKRRKQPAEQSQSERVKEVSRRSGILLRRHLELLHAEGSLTNEDVDGIVSNNPRTISAEQVQISVPQRNPYFQPVHMTYLEASESLLGYIAQELSNTFSVLQQLDPMKMGWFRGTDADTLVIDLIISTLLVRNQALYGLFSEAEAASIEARSGLLISGKMDTQHFALYDLLKKVWLESVAGYQVPQLSISNEIIRRSSQRTNQPYQENLLQEIGMAEVLVNTRWYFWPTIKATTILVADNSK